jgi:hypothetical protein
MQTPQSLAEAKAMLKTEEDKALGTLDVIIGSRWLMAILATCVLAFGLHAVYAPTWLPSFTGLSLANFGLPSHLELGPGTHEVAAAWQRQNGNQHIQALASEHADLFPYINIAGFAVCFILLLVNLTIMTKRRRFTRG